MNYTLITGASKGIGKAFAYECASRGQNLLLVARSGQLLQEIAIELIAKGVQVHTHTADLLDHAVHTKIFDWIKTNGWNVNMLVNNAGIGHYGQFDKEPLEKHMQVMHLNMDTMVRMAHAFLNNSNTKQRRYILNTVSIGAFQPVPYIGVYSATKSFMLSFSLAIRHELRKQNVYVTAFCPGGVDTDFFGPAGMEVVAKRNKKFIVKAEEVIPHALNAVMKNKAVYTNGLTNKMGMLSVRLFPYSVVVPVAAKLYEPE